jgi:predicted alpha/beta superfamily hydrolase
MKLSLLLSIFFLSQIGNAQSCFKTHTIKSNVLKEKRSIWIGLPQNYNKDSSYSVVYVLDAEDRFEITYSLTKELFENQNSIPELIVVGIPNVDKVRRLYDMTFTDSQVNATGKKDTIGYFGPALTGNGPSFLKFLENEVVQYVDVHYNTDGLNTLIGHSIGGYFCSYILPIQKSFSAFQIYDPSIWYNDGDAINHIQRGLDSKYKSQIFISKGTVFNGPRENVEHHLLMIDSLGTVLIDYPNLNVSTASYEKDHNAMYMFSVMDGLTTLFKDE